MNKNLLILALFLIVATVSSRKAVLRQEEELNPFGQGVGDWFFNNLIMSWIQNTVFGWLVFIQWWAGLFGIYEWFGDAGINFYNQETWGYPGQAYFPVEYTFV